MGDSKRNNIFFPRDEKYKLKSCFGGSVTVFLSLVLILVLALVGTMLEGARVRIAGRIEQRDLKTAVNAVFSEYYRPLYDDYHLFFLSKNVKEDGGSSFLGDVSEYMKGMLEVEEDSLFSGTDLYQIVQKQFEISQAEYAVDEGGKIFSQEATAYMKYKSTAKLIESLMAQMNALKSSEETAKLMEKKLDLESDMGELDEMILEMMEKIEGLSHGRNGLKKLRNGLLKTESYFAKMFSPKGVNQSAAGISDSLVWNSVREKYSDPYSKLTRMENASRSVQSISESIKRVRKKIEQEEEDFSRIEDPKKGQIKSHENKIERYYKELNRLEEEMEEPYEQMDQEKGELVRQARKIQGKMEDALSKMPELEQKQQQLGEELKIYQNELSQSSSKLDAEVYQGLSEDCQAKEQYIDAQGIHQTTSYISHILGMEEVLRKDSAILDSFEQLDQSFDFQEEEEVTRYQQVVHELRMQLLDYEIASLSFDYSSISVKEQPNPLEALSELINKGIKGLVFDEPEALSKRSLSVADHNLSTYGKDAVKKSDENVQAKEYGSQLSDMDEQGYQEGIGDGFGALGESISEVEEQGKLDELLESILLNEYLLAHFKNVCMDDNVIANQFLDGGQKEQTQKQDNNEKTEPVLQKESAMLYELEYILSGKQSDEDAVMSNIDWIIFVRSIFNFIYLMTDSQRKQEAYLAGAAIVGFTGLEALVRLTQTLILLAWAYEEAIVDAAFLVGGLKVPIIKTKQDFQLSFEELFLMSRKLIRTKMEQKTGQGKNSARNLLALDYQGWLRVFLLLHSQEQRCMRAMDLIDENMKLRNTKAFSMGSLLYGINVKATCELSPKFVSLPFVTIGEENNTSPWTITEDVVVAY